jgi:broad specificity phosphatase PhoE
MARLYLVRHGEAAAGYGDSLDPGLSDLGRTQAEAAADTLARLPRMSLLSSPLRRARETAVPLERRWNLTATIDPTVGEVASPESDPAKRSAWLKQVMQQRYPDVSAELRAWRDALVGYLRSCTGDTTIFSHFVAINAAVGAATDDDRLLNFHPDNGSITVLETDGHRLALVERGAEAATRVL